MFIKTLFLSTLAVAGLATAQTSKACSADSNTVNSAADVQALASCQTLEGDLIVGEDLGALELDQLQVIKGNLIANNVPNLQTINFPVLRMINGQMQLKSCRSLSTLNAPSLASVGEIEWVTLELQSFTTAIKSVKSIVISDTKLTAITGIDPTTVQSCDINNNQYLKSVTMNLKNVTTLLSMGFNAKNIAISFPELSWSKNLTLIGAGSIDLPKLVHINGSMNIGNTSVTSISCKNLTAVEQTLAFIGNTAVTDLEFPVLKEIGGAFKIHNNSKLVNIDGFPKLEQVRGAIDFVGNFNNCTLSELQDVQGGFNLQTTEKFDCTEFDDDKAEGVIKGDSYTCKGLEADPKTADGQSGADGSGSSGSKTGDDNGNSAGRVGISALLGLSVAAVAFVF